MDIGTVGWRKGIRVNFYEANRILDRVREGQQFSSYVILRALELTGDYEGNGSKGMDQSFPDQVENAGVRQCQSLVGGNS
jgi:hypothetical protein